LALEPIISTEARSRAASNARSGKIAGAIVSALGYPPIFLFAAAMAVLSVAIPVALSLQPATTRTLVTDPINTGI